MRTPGTFGSIDARKLTDNTAVDFRLAAGKHLATMVGGIDTVGPRLDIAHFDTLNGYIYRYFPDVVAWQLFLSRTGLNNPK